MCRCIPQRPATITLLPHNINSHNQFTVAASCDKMEGSVWHACLPLNLPECCLPLNVPDHTSEMSPKEMLIVSLLNSPRPMSPSWSGSMLRQGGRICQAGHDSAAAAAAVAQVVVKCLHTRSRAPEASTSAVISKLRLLTSRSAATWREILRSTFDGSFHKRWKHAAPDFCCC